MTPVLGPVLKLEALDDTTLTTVEKSDLSTFINTLITSDLSDKKEFKKSETGLARTVVFISKEEIYILLNSRKSGDAVLGAGAVKTFKKALNVMNGQLFATCSLIPGADFEHEMSVRSDMEDIPHTQKPIQAKLHYEVKGVPKVRLFESLYAGDLEKIASTHTLTMDAKVALAKNLLEALEGFHAKGYIHRDIKPGNIFVEKTHDGFKADLCDFGVAVKKEDKTLQIFPQGTFEFFSPEYSDYKTKPLETPESYKALERKRLELITEINSVIDPGKPKFLAFKLTSWVRANSTKEGFSETKAALDAKIAELTRVESELSRSKPTKDFSCVTTEQHDIYAMGLVLYSLFTSKSKLETLQAERLKEDADWTKLDFDGSETPFVIQNLISDMLKKDPTARLKAEGITSFLASN